MEKESRYLEYATLAESIIFSDKFLNLSHTAQLLYVFINIAAWEDGSVHNCHSFARVLGCDENDIHYLIENGFIKRVEDRYENIYQIVHWDIHNFNHLANNRSSGEYAKWKKTVLERDVV